MPAKTGKIIPVYTAILMDMEKQCLPSSKKATKNGEMEWKNEDERMSMLENDTLPSLGPCPRSMQLVAGSLVGILAALLGLRVIHTSLFSAQSLGSNYVSVFLIALAWSTLTAGLAYLVFSATIQIYARCLQSTPLEEPLLDGEENSLLDEEEANGSHSVLTSEQKDDPIGEYYFVLGVFVGFCATATVHDASNGVPVTSLLCTAGFAILCGLFIVGCSFRRNKMEQHCQQRQEKAAVRLPLIIV
jgi:hypothetical protein